MKLNVLTHKKKMIRVSFQLSPQTVVFKMRQICTVTVNSVHTGLEVCCLFRVLLYHYFHFSHRMSPVPGWILALNATFGKPF